jgi:serine/threonine-protein kinase
MAKPEPKSPVKEGEIVDGKYKIERILGVGGMGVVVAATHQQLGQKVALKFLLPHVLDGDQSAARFLREARASVRLKSEHVARVFDVGTLATGEPYSVMEYLEGCDLSTHANANKPLRIADAVEYVLQGCEAIVEAHALGIVHRDLKPQNLFVTRRANGAPLVKVLDFGISKGPLGAGEMSLTDSTIVLGSPLYMAPEQMRSARNADVRSDVWSLGVILYELLTGQVPFDGETMTELCLKVVNEPPPPPRDLRGELPEPLAKIVSKCLEKDPDKRFQNVAMLADALEPFSTSAERGASDRGWRSLVDTADASDHASFAAARDTGPGSLASSGVDAQAKKISTETAWGDTQGGNPVLVASPPSVRRKRAFAGGVAAGVVGTIGLGILTAALLWPKDTTRSQAGSPSEPSAAPMIPTTGASAPATAAISATASALAVASAAPLPSISASASPSDHQAVAVHASKVRPTAPRPSAKPAAVAPPATATAAATVSPNGAPILR